MNESIVILVALTTGLVQCVKMFILDNRFYPLISVLIGIILCLIAPSDMLSGQISNRVFVGFIVGLSASGLYSQVQKGKDLIISGGEINEQNKKKEGENDVEN